MKLINELAIFNYVDNQMAGHDIHIMRIFY
jgi:hypothetical protein